MMDQSLWAMLVAGGPVMFILLALSVLSLALIVAKTVQLIPATSGSDRRDDALARWQQGDKDGAMAAVVAADTPADRLLAYAMQSLTDGLSGPALEGDLTRRGNEELARLSSWLRLLDLIAMVSPLLGLLGTVLGMVQSFQDLAAAEGSANASVLAGGIWLALLTTAGGLMVAIPAAVAASLLSGRVETVALRIEGALGRLMLIETGKGRSQ